MGEPAPLSGPDLAEGIAEGDLEDRKPLLGHAHGEAIVLAREAGKVYAVGATCTHYSGPLAEGLVHDGSIRCPWHHACFDLATGAAHGPALAPIACWDVVLEGGKLRVGAKRERVTPVRAPLAKGPASIVIIGAGAAGIACATALRAEGHTGGILIVSSEDAVDRPNLSKDYLAGTAPEEWVFLAVPDGVTVVRGTATAIEGKSVVLADGKQLSFDALLIATGAEPIRLPIPGADLPHVHVLRTLADSRAIAASQGPVVVIGASFIGLEAAAALRVRGLDITVVGPETVPLARVLGDEVGAFVQRVHEGKGVAFRLGRKPVRITADAVELDDGTSLPAKSVVMGVGVRPRTELAASAGLAIDRGVVVDEHYLAAPGIWAAGDIARFPWQGQKVRIEHWQVAVRQGQAVARAMLGLPAARADVPFFWSQHHDVTLGYVGHAETFDSVSISGDLDARDAHATYRLGSEIVAQVTINRDYRGLEVEASIEDHLMERRSGAKPSA